MTPDGDVKLRFNRSGIGGLYQLEKASNRISLYKTTVLKSFDPQILHQVLGHVNVGILRQLTGSKNLELTACEGCSKGKLAQHPHRKGTRHRTTRILGTLHTDTVDAGYVGAGGFRYFVTVVDEATRYIFILLLRSKREVSEALVKLIQREQKKKGSNKKMHEFTETEGIEISSPPPYDHNGNPIAERSNRRISEIARSFLYSAKLSVFFWPYAVHHACFVYNLLHHSTIGCAPMDLFDGPERTSYFQQKLFLWGSLIWAHVPKEKRTGKFDPCASAAILLGFEKPSGVYVIWDLENNRESTTRTFKSTNRFLSNEELGKYGVLQDTAMLCDRDDDRDDDWIADNSRNIYSSESEDEGKSNCSGLRSIYPESRDEGNSNTRVLNPAIERNEAILELEKGRKGDASISRLTRA
jgi:hypothetical protein